MRAAAIMCLTFALVGCTSSSAERDERQRERMAVNAEASCRAIGLDQASEKWTDCMIEMMAAEQRSEGARRAATQAQGGNQGRSFMCKDAISRGDSGGTFIFC